MTALDEKRARLRARMPPQRADNQPVTPAAWAAMTANQRRDHLGDLDGDRVFALARAVAAAEGRSVWELITDWHAAGLIGPQNR